MGYLRATSLNHLTGYFNPYREAMPESSSNLPQNIKPPVPNSWKSEALPHKFCPGCGNGDILKLLGQILDEQNSETLEKIRIFYDTSCFVMMSDIFRYPATKVLHNADITKIFDADNINIFLVGEEGGKYIYYNAMVRHMINEGLPAFIIITKNGIGGGFALSSQNVPKKPDPLFAAPQPYTPTMDMPSIIDKLDSSNAGYIARGSIGRLGQLKSSVRKGFDTIKTGKPALLEILSVCPYLSMCDAKSNIKLTDEQLLVYEIKDYAG